MISNSPRGATSAALLALAGLSFSPTGCERKQEAAPPPLVLDNSNPGFHGMRQRIASVAAQVDCYPVTNSTYTLIAVKQIHGAHALMGNGMAARHAFIQRQQDLANVLDVVFQERENPIAAVYPEGVSVETFSIYSDDIARLSKGIDVHNPYFDVLTLVSASPQEIAAGAGTFVSVIKANIPIRPAESAELNLKRVEAADRGESTTDIMCKLPQDFLLSRIDGDFSGKSVSVGTVWGGGHDFTGTVAEWNFHHPDRQFSLIVVEPNSVREYYMEQKANK